MLGTIMIVAGFVLLFLAGWLYSKFAARTDGDMLAGLEDEDGLVFQLETPVNEMIKKKKVIFRVRHVDMRIREKGRSGK